jgi:hypothetical protein
MLWLFITLLVHEDLVDTNPVTTRFFCTSDVLKLPVCHHLHCGLHLQAKFNSPSPVQVMLIPATSIGDSSVGMLARKIPDLAQKVNSSLRKLQNYSYEDGYEDDPDHPPSRTKQKRIVPAK